MPRNLNFWYVFGSLALLVLLIQFLSGIFLAIHYKPDVQKAFASVELTIMRDVPWGHVLRYMHSTGASAFFIVVYLHVFRGMIYGSHRRPREVVWFLGCLLFVCLMASAFTGYLLPWGQMSRWGAEVIVNLFSAIPWVGETLVLFMRGDHVVGDATLGRFYVFHVIVLPLALVLLVVLHLMALHDVGSNNPDGIDIQVQADWMPMHPYQAVRDLFGMALFLLCFFAVVFFAPEFGGYFLEHSNFVSADEAVSLSHIRPAWYFAPFYAMLRATTGPMIWVFTAALAWAVAHVCIKASWAVPIKAVVALTAAVVLVLMRTLDVRFWGVAVLVGAVLCLFFLPWLDRSPVRSLRYRPIWHSHVNAVFVLAFCLLGWLGLQPPSPVVDGLAQLATTVYFGFFLLMPWWSRLGAPRPLPQRLTRGAGKRGQP